MGEEAGMAHGQAVEGNKSNGRSVVTVVCENQCLA
jgi:hypothetical protein